MKKVWIPRIKLESNGDRLPFKFGRTQFPVKAAFALSINKSQVSQCYGVNVIYCIFRAKLLSEWDLTLRLPCSHMDR